ncbi:DNRLRE domain-containing protein [Kitasatospora aburaviensis]
MKDGRTLSLSWPKPLPKPTLAGNVASYPEVLPGVDVQLKAEVEGFSQLVVVKTAAAAANPELATLKYTMSTVGVTVSTDAATGVVQALDPAGQPVFTSPTPVMWDSTTATSAPPSGAPAAKSMSFAAAAAGAAPAPTAPASTFDQPAGSKEAVMPTAVSGNTLQITPDQALLKAADTKYPVYIDPSWAWGGRQNWTRVYKKRPKDSFWNANDVARVGYESETNGLSRSFFQMDTGNIRGAKVISSTFRIDNTWSWSCQARPVQLWHTKGIDRNTTWEHQPDRIDWLGTVNQSKGWSSNCPGGNLEWDVTWKIQRVAAAGDPNITVGLYAENENDTYGWKKFDPKSVVLETKYNDPPLTPTDLGTNPHRLRHRRPDRQHDGQPVRAGGRPERREPLRAVPDLPRRQPGRRQVDPRAQGPGLHAGRTGLRTAHRRLHLAGPGVRPERVLRLEHHLPVRRRPDAPGPAAEDRLLRVPQR